MMTMLSALYAAACCLTAAAPAARAQDASTVFTNPAGIMLT